MAVSVAWTTSARAQQGAAVLTGKVVDASSKKPLVDVVVTVTSPALQGEQIVTTDKSGAYRVPSLAPGVYTLRLDKEGYRPHRKDEIQLRADTTIRLDADLLPEGLAAQEVVIVAHAPTVDVGSSTTGGNIDSSFTSRIPVTNPGARGGAQRTFESVAEATPGASSDQFGTAIAGSTSPENTYVIDGLRTSNARYGTNGSPLSIEFIKEVNVLSGGYMPEYGRSTGGIFNVVTKSGSNELHGNVWANWTPGALEGPRKYPYFQGYAVQTRRSLGDVFDLGFDQSGPIVKDKLWYYVGFGVSRAIYDLDRSIHRDVLDPNDGAVLGREPIPGSTESFEATQTSYQFFAKVDYRINPDNKLALTFAATPTFAGGGGDYAVNPQSGLVEGAITELNLAGAYGALAHTYRSGAYDTVLKWTSELDNKAKIIETSAGWHHELGGKLGADGFDVGSGLGLSAVAQVPFRRTDPSLHNLTDFENVPGCRPMALRNGNMGSPCPMLTYTGGGPGQLEQLVLDTYAAKSILTVLAQGAGHHVIKVGAELELSTSWYSRGYSGTVQWREATDGATFFAAHGYGQLTRPDEALLLDRLVSRSHSLNAGGFIQDSWQIVDRITLNAGLRYDNQFMFGTDGKLLITMPHQLSPRIGVIFDPTQNGQSKLFFNYARFYQSVPLDLMDRQTGEEELRQAVSSSACDPLNPNQASGVCRTSAARVRYPASGGFQANGLTDRQYLPFGAGKAIIDPDLDPQSSSEIVAGGEYQISKNARAGISYTRRWMNHVIEDMSKDEGASFFIGNPGKGLASSFPEATRNYDAGTAYVMKAFADRWLAQVSYTLSWLRGNQAGLYDPATGQLDPNMNSTFDLKSLLPNQQGDLPNDHRHAIKVFGAKDFAVTRESELQLGASVSARSGGPTSYLGAHNLYGPDRIYILPRGSGDRLPWNGSVGTHAGYVWRFQSGTSFGLTLDIFNLLNLQGPLSSDPTYTTSDVLPIVNGSRGDLGNIQTPTGAAFDPKSLNPNFGSANSYQEPRQFRFGVRGGF
ncbi:TonB-dependent receptor domain-containing protein [Pendulispora albinea]|uniref:TonB-dependent receptor n=1 Tax=Pendulispora albinea TaxID=2741071 RepID=A0ABZ2M4K0_9BACT